MDYFVRVYCNKTTLKNAMQTIHTFKRGGAIIGLVVAVVGVLTGGIGLIILDAVSCDFNVVFSSGCGDGGGGGGGGGGGPLITPTTPPVACVSPQNSCSMTNTGFIDSGSCNATAPDDSLCPAPVINVGTDFTANPNPVQVGQTTTITWNTSNSTSCTLTGGGLNTAGGPSGSVTTGAIQQVTNFTLTCSNGIASQTSATITVRLIPRYQEL